MRSLEQLIEDQVRRWSREQKAKKFAGKSRQTPWPIISISRQFGSRGSAIGEGLAERTGFTFWGSVLLHRMADEANANEAALAWVDEHPRSAWNDFIDGMPLGDEYTESEYLRRLVRVLHGIQTTGAGVVVGRGSQFILSAGKALRVRFACPLADRIRGVMEGHKLDEIAAARLVKKVDRERQAFMQSHFGQSLEDPSNFDLTLNSGSMPEEVCLETILTAYEERVGRRPRV
ncbi:MAG: cytidylate kinase-like family protein [Myxococcota bacterium]|nr:cytidylate kinase-like family protein [Myxococcota bacterium]